MNIAIAYYKERGFPDVAWDVPTGIKFAFERLGHTVKTFTFDRTYSTLSQIIHQADSFDFIWLPLWEHSIYLIDDVARVKAETNLKVIVDCSDEPQRFGMYNLMLPYADAVGTPDLRCQKVYAARGYNAHWLNHWGDEYVFRYDPSVERANRCVTTVHGSDVTQHLKAKFGDKFVNQSVSPADNLAFHNSGTIGFQRARHDEITRRIMESGGCKLAMLANRISTDTGIYQLFVDGEDIFYYDSKEEAEQKLAALLNDDSLRNRMAENIYEKINKFHRAETRCNQLIEIYKKL